MQHCKRRVPQLSYASNAYFFSLNQNKTLGEESFQRNQILKQQQQQMHTSCVSLFVCDFLSFFCC
jgi:hypothetical protein